MGGLQWLRPYSAPMVWKKLTPFKYDNFRYLCWVSGVYTLSTSNSVQFFSVGVYKHAYLEPQGDKQFKNGWMEMVISNHFLCKDWVKIIQLIANHFYINGWPWGFQVIVTFGEITFEIATRLGP